MNIHLNKHVIDDKEEVDDFRCHDKDGKATGRLVKTHTLNLTAKLERSWKKYKAMLLYLYGTFQTQKQLKALQATYWLVLLTVEFLCSSHTVAEHKPLTYGCGLHHECDNAEEVDIGVVHSELNKDRLSVHIKPGGIIKVLKRPT